MQLNFINIRYPSPIYGLSMLSAFLIPGSNLTYLTNKPKVDKIPTYLLNLSPFKPAANIILTVLQGSVIAYGRIPFLALARDRYAKASMLIDVLFGNTNISTSKEF